MKKLYLLPILFVFIAVSCTKDVQVDPDFQKSKVTLSQKESQPDVAKAVASCPAGYKPCKRTGLCVPYNTSYTCHTDVSLEYTTETQTSITCDCVWTTVTTKSHSYQVTWDSGYIPTADKTGHTRSIDYKCFNALRCNITCNQVKHYNSGWLAHRPNPSSPNYCLDCKIKYR